MEKTLKKNRTTFPEEDTYEEESHRLHDEWAGLSQAPIPREEIKRNELEKIKKADHIFFIRPYGISHHLIVEDVRISSNELLVIHYTKNEVKREWLNVYDQPGELYIALYPESNPEDVLKRAKDRIGEKQYNLFFNNCEHFASYCKTGIPNCCQTQWASEKSASSVVKEMLKKMFQKCCKTIYTTAAACAQLAFEEYYKRILPPYFSLDLQLSQMTTIVQHITILSPEWIGMPWFKSCNEALLSISKNTGIMNNHIFHRMGMLDIKTFSSNFGKVATAEAAENASKIGNTVGAGCLLLFEACHTAYNIFNLYKAKTQNKISETEFKKSATQRATEAVFSTTLGLAGGLIGGGVMSAALGTLGSVAGHAIGSVVGRWIGNWLW